MLQGALDLIDLTFTKRLLVGKLIRTLCFNNEVELGLFGVPQALPAKNNTKIGIAGTDRSWNLVEGRELEKANDFVVVVADMRVPQVSVP